MRELNHQDLQWALRRTPGAVLKLLKDQPSKLFVAGGFVRACIAGEPVNDIDLFASSMDDAKMYAVVLEAKAGAGGKMIETGNAFTVKGYPIPVQIIHRWAYEAPEELLESFDFTIAKAGFWWGEGHAARPECVVAQPESGGWDVGVNTLEARPSLPPGWRSMCDYYFYEDLAAKRLRYTSPKRSEDAGGSLLRVLKFYQRGYRIPLDSMGAVVARLVNGVREYGQSEADFAKVITGLLHEVDPNIDPSHIAHLPAESEEMDVVSVLEAASVGANTLEVPLYEE